MKRRWTIHVIHHSHTDIGYTERQEKLERYHVDFIRQAIGILNGVHSAVHPNWRGFTWTCENTWQVERFLEQATEEETNDFWHYVHSGEIGLSGNYLNMTELVDMRVLENKLGRGLTEVRKHASVTSAMSADVNGYAWGYAQALLGQGIQNLISCIHPHHGMYPGYAKQRPFWWEAPSGEKLFVWVCDHYHIGNEMLLAPRAGINYTTRDELAGLVLKDPLKVRETRLTRYLENLEAEGYPYDLLPIMVSGISSDNGCPNGKIMDVLQEWNASHGDSVHLKMSSLDAYFAEMRPRCEDAPVYRGDFTDWWADGVGSTPAAVKQVRDAQRKYDLCQKLDPQGTLGSPQRMAEAEDAIMLYTEHTWGYSSSVSEPWATLVNDLDLRKTNYAVDANVAASRNLDAILAAKGETTIRPDRDKLYTAVNPHDRPVNGTVKLNLEHWEMVEETPVPEGVPFDDFAEIVDAATGQVLPSQSTVISRAREIEVAIALEPGEERQLLLRRTGRVPARTTASGVILGAEGVADFALSNPSVSVHGIHNEFFDLEFDENGIVSWRYRQDGGDLIRPGSRPFGATYQRTPLSLGATPTRTAMGRNRCSMATQHFNSQLTNITVERSGPVFDLVKLHYSLEGTRMYAVLLKAYKQSPRVQATVILHKESYWEPENLYVALPFRADDQQELFIEKTGCVIRPGIDQIPGTCMDFYLIQQGLAYVSPGKSLSIAVRDTPLITLAPLHHHPIELCSGDNVELNRACVYSWVMNNFWETNFKVDLSGFYEFTYDVTLHRGAITPEDAIADCHSLNEGLIGFPV